MPKWSILGTVGVPGSYGGFETLAENLVHFHASHDLKAALSVYCSSKVLSKRYTKFRHANLRYVSLDANGPQSVPYDILSLLDAVLRRTDVILLLGVSGALALPLVRAISRCRIVTNIDGIEWKRGKWPRTVRVILRLSERAAVRWSHTVVADNTAIADYVRQSYGRECTVIPYGGDHALIASPAAIPGLKLPESYALALCRIEPENNIAMILDAFARTPNKPLVFVGNWDKSDYGRALRRQYSAAPNLHLLDPVYSPQHLRWLRDRASAYIHGHSAGGTNPSLVEMMHFGVPVFAHGCSFNRITTENKARYFMTASELKVAVEAMNCELSKDIGASMREIAIRRYRWELIGSEYFRLFENVLE
ncbi:DUF1972 domain-containing protein [Seongchinamella sediminis]|uniref:DUF1972 domain-containing protein n=2 Tax=Seongchinamella sediminis TaxID=2283635 RepID=A0A3L7DYM7_9GAMM|nr:DUF1972 domain-containing protein [Seongchinamella sediminis]